MALYTAGNNACLTLDFDFSDSILSSTRVLCLPVPRCSIKTCNALVASFAVRKLCCQSQSRHLTMYESTTGKVCGSETSIRAFGRSLIVGLKSKSTCCLEIKGCFFPGALSKWPCEFKWYSAANITGPEFRSIGIFQCGQCWHSSNGYSVVSLTLNGVQIQGIESPRKP